MWKQCRRWWWWCHTLQLRGLCRSLHLPRPLLQSGHNHNHLPDSPTPNSYHHRTAAGSPVISSAHPSGLAAPRIAPSLAQPVGSAVDSRSSNGDCLMGVNPMKVYTIASHKMTTRKLTVCATQIGLVKTQTNGIPAY